MLAQINVENTHNLNPLFNIDKANQKGCTHFTINNLKDLKAQMMNLLLPTHSYSLQVVSTCRDAIEHITRHYLYHFFLHLFVSPWIRVI